MLAEPKRAVAVARDNKQVSSVLSRVGLRKSAFAAGVPCDAPSNVPGEVLDLFKEDPTLRERIVEFHQTQAHLDELVPALQDYQRHQQGLADAEQRIGMLLQEAGMRAPGEFCQALHDCGAVHRQAGARRLESHADEERNVTSVLVMHLNEAAADCRRAVHEYEASRKELSVLHQARTKAQSTKQQLTESGANKVDSKLTPSVESAADKVENRARQKLQDATEKVVAKIAMLEVKHKLDYATSLSYHMKNMSQEEKDLAGILGDVSGPVRAIQESAAHADLET